MSCSGAEASPASPTVAVLGLGRMGQAVVERLTGDYQVSVWNRSPAPAARAAEAGGRPAGSIAEAVRGCRAVMTSLTDGAAVRDVVLDAGLARSMVPGATLIDLSTIDVTTSEQVADSCAAAAIGYLRAPVSGNPDTVRQGRAALLVSGAADVVNEHRNLLQTIAPTVHYLGEGEESRVAKLCVNLMLAGITELFAEVVVLGERSGLSRETLADALSKSVVGSTFLGYKAEAALARDYRATFTTLDLRKDLRLLREQAQDVDVPVPVGAAVAELVDDAIAKGMGDLDFLSLLPRLQAAAGIAPDIEPPVRS